MRQPRHQSGRTIYLAWWRRAIFTYPRSAIMARETISHAEFVDYMRQCRASHGNKVRSARTGAVESAKSGDDAALMSFTVRAIEHQTAWDLYDAAIQFATDKGPWEFIKWCVHNMNADPSTAHTHAADHVRRSARYALDDIWQTFQTVTVNTPDVVWY